MAQRISLSGSGKVLKKKSSLSQWAGYSTVSWRLDAKHDFIHHGSTAAAGGGSCVHMWHGVQSWMIPAAIGVCTAASGSLIEVCVDLWASLRFGYCPGRVHLTEEHCGEGWVAWSDLGFPYLLYVAVSCGLVLVAALLVRFVAPEARGSGIPEVKTILGGFIIAKVLDFKTLVTKIVGLGFSVGAGLSCGKEGPLVHIACCWSNLLSRFIPRWRNNEAKQRELLSTAAAAGVSVAFGAPLGGVLFSLEEVSTMFPSRTMIRAFFAATIAALTLAWLDPTGTGKLTLFQTSYNVPPAWPEYIGFIFLGIAGGLIGAVFVHYNIMVSAGRAKGSSFRRRCPEVLEVLIICFVTAVTSFPNRYATVLSSKTIRALFSRCSDHEDPNRDMMGLCDGDEPRTDAPLALLLLTAGLLRYVQMIFTFGTGVPAGLFVPCLFTGACLGRVVGMAAHAVNALVPGSLVVVNPGAYAMVGAASVLGGVCRVTISLVVIMFELTGGLQMVVPFMCACLVSKWVGDLFTGGIYDCAIRLRGYPYLHEPEESAFTTTAKDIMDTELDVIDCLPTTLGELLELARTTEWGGFPLVRSKSDFTLLGYVHAKDLRQHLEQRLKENQLLSERQAVVFQRWAPECSSKALDLSELVDETAYRCVQEMPAKEIHEMFRKLGLKLLLVVRFAELVGMITKKSFIQHLEEIEDGSVEQKPAPDFEGTWRLSEPSAVLAAPLLVGHGA